MEVGQVLTERLNGVRKFFKAYFYFSMLSKKKKFFFSSFLDGEGYSAFQSPDLCE